LAAALAFLALVLAGLAAPGCAGDRPSMAAGAALRVRQVEAEQAEGHPERVPKISMHEHFRAGASIDTYLDAARTLGVERALFVPTGEGPDNRGYRENMAELLAVQRSHPDQVIAFATVDELDPAAASILEEAVREGARGLKLIGGHPHFYRAPLDSPNLHAVYEVARRHHLPVLIHASLRKFPSQHAELERMLDAFPDVQVIAAHYAEMAPDLDGAQALFDAHRNLWMDLAMGGGLPRYEKQIDAEPERFRAFIVRNQDRLLWGTDVILRATTDPAFLRRRIGKDLHILEREFYVDPDLAPDQVRHGLHLPEGVLRKIYRENPLRLLASAPPPPPPGP
jgi:predicted TIM-barrel fold metal-dependent hydrolase